MLKRIMMLAALAGVTGCAGTPQATSEPAATPTQPSSALAQMPEQVPALMVADVTPAKSEPAASRAAEAPYHYQCMLAWAKGVQDAMTPWTHTAQACDVRPAKP